MGMEYRILWKKIKPNGISTVLTNVRTAVERAIQRAYKLEENENLPTTPVKKKLRICLDNSEDELSTDTIHSSDKPVCFFCNLPTNSNDPVVQTMTFDFNIRLMAHELQDRKLISKLSAGDVIALDVVYHKHFYTDLYTKYRSSMRAKNKQ